MFEAERLAHSSVRHLLCLGPRVYSRGGYPQRTLKAVLGHHTSRSLRRTVLLVLQTNPTPFLNRLKAGFLCYGDVSLRIHYRCFFFLRIATGDCLLLSLSAVNQKVCHCCRSFSSSCCLLSVVCVSLCVPRRKDS